MLTKTTTQNRSDEGWARKKQPNGRTERSAERHNSGNDSYEPTLLRKTRPIYPPFAASFRCMVFGGTFSFWCRQMQIEKLEMQQEKAVTREILNEALRGSEAIRDVATKVL